jgi:transcriptional regulator with XRE-family HTH domain
MSETNIFYSKLATVKKNNIMNYGKGLKTIREGLDMDMIPFADLCHVTPGTIFKLEEGIEELNNEDRETIINALNIPIEFLVGLSTELKDVPPFFEERYLETIEMMTEATILLIRAEIIKEEKIDLVHLRSLMDNVSKRLNG